MSTAVQAATSKQSHSKRELSESSVASRGPNNKRFVFSVQDDEILSDKRTNAADFLNFVCLPVNHQQVKEDLQDLLYPKTEHWLELIRLIQLLMPSIQVSMFRRSKMIIIIYQVFWI